MDTTEICFDDSSNEDENLLKLPGNRKKREMLPITNIQWDSLITMRNDFHF